MNVEDRNRLVENIKIAFKDVPIPSYVGYELDELEGKKWENISPQDLRRVADELTSFSDEGFRYFLPAILISVILHSKEVDVLTENIIHKLAPPDKEERYYKEHLSILKRRANILDAKQKNVVKGFLLSYKELEPHGGWSFMESDTLTLERAIEFWEQF